MAQKLQSTLFECSMSVDHSGGPPSSPAPQARGVYGRRRHMKYATVVDAVIDAVACLI